MESHLEARLWNDVFVFAQSALGLPLGTIKATCLIETLPAAFELRYGGPRNFQQVSHLLLRQAAGLSNNL